MGKKFVIRESEISEIRKMYGLVTEQKYMEKYDGSLLNFCAYRAIERFEEIMGGPKGESMGDDYFETRLKTYESWIKSNIEKTIGLNVFNSFPVKLKMQIWSWMFNNTDASDGTLKWLAGLSQAMNMGKFKDDSDAQSYRLKVSKKGSVENLNAISEIINFKGSWDEVYNNYLYVLDKQYVSTAENNNKQGSYDNSWKFRPSKLDEFYNECSSGKKTTPQSKSLDKTSSSLDNQVSSEKIDIFGGPNYKPISNSEADAIRRKIGSLNSTKELESTPKTIGGPKVEPLVKPEVKITNKPEVKSVIRKAKRGVLSPDEEL